MEEKTTTAPPESFRVVLASVTNLLYPVDIDLIHYLFSKYGEIEKIVTFSKSPTMYQALIQFQSPDQARHALMNLHSRNIYDGCNTLQIQPSRLNELVVKNNTQKSWDYTVQSGGPSGSAGATGDLPPPGQAPGAAVPAGVNNGRNVGPGPAPHHPGPHGPPGPYGAGAQHPPMGGAVAGIQPPPPAHAIGHHAAPVHHGVRLGAGGPLGMSHPYHPGSNLLHLLDKLPRELREIESTNPTQTPVIIVYNLPANITVHMLFNLFSLYGSVLRVKILREKSDTALIQYSDPLYATIAHNYIQGANVLGQSLQVGFSKNMEVKLPPPNSQKTEATAEEEKRTVAFSIKDQRYGVNRLAMQELQ
ncbi:RNA recognition motif-containing protein [Toxoplasma gondii VAND]|uniref:RNA recognition motif-containing protein n=3 Tax=Toxoplasma gondii TaxID=5811 RepID=A0A086PHW7_TOXGO|nr:RNA recognition motif-containing protein [Toxoplasma gondii VAND]